MASKTTSARAVASSRRKPGKKFKITIHVAWSDYGPKTAKGAIEDIQNSYLFEDAVDWAIEAELIPDEQFEEAMNG